MLTDSDVLPLPSGRLVLRRAWPRSRDHVLLEYVDRDGQPVAAQWLRDAEQRRRTLAGTPAPAFLVPGSCVLVQPAGVDRKLRSLAAVLAEPGARLVAHRPERRAVVRRADGSFVKVVRPGRSEGLALAAARVAAVEGHPEVPQLLEHDPDRGILVWSALPGLTLHEQATMSGGARSPADWAEAWRLTGRAVGHLHAAATDGLVTRGVEDERRAAARWIGPARDLGLLPPGPDLSEAVMAGADPLEPSTDVTLHGDLHDKQVVVGPSDHSPAGRRIGLLDLDQLARGDAALDIANLLTHIELRVRQELISPGAAAVARVAFLDGLGPSDATRARVAALSPLVRLRLAGLYAFRPPWRGLARRLHASVWLLPAEGAGGHCPGDDSPRDEYTDVPPRQAGAVAQHFAQPLGQGACGQGLQERARP